MNKKLKVLLSDDGTEFTGGCTSASVSYTHLRAHET